MADIRLIPNGILDESTQALNECIEQAFSFDISPLLVNLIDNVDASTLPHLAEQFHITGNEGWLLASTEEKKRNLIKASIELHKYKGTKYAIKKVLEMLNLDGDVEEWFQYDGEPYHFKVNIDLLNREMNQETKQRLNALINEFKNTRSWLELIKVFITPPCEVPQIAAISQFGKIIMAQPYFETEKTAPDGSRIISGAYHMVHIIQAEPQEV